MNERDSERGLRPSRFGNLAADPRVILMSILLLAVAARLLTISLTPSLARDAVGYLAFTETFSFADLYAASPREPFLIATVELMTHIVGTNGAAPQLVSFFSGLGVAIWGTWVGIRLAGIAVGWIAGGLLALSPYFMHWDISGTRDGFAALLLFLALGSIFVSDARFRWAILLPAAAVLPMVKFDVAIPLVIGLALGVAARKINIRLALLAVALAAAAALPFFVSNLHGNDDPLYHLNRHARFYWNIDFAGLPGEPTLEEVEQDSYVGPRVTTVEYIRQFSTGELFDRAIESVEGTILRGTLSLFVPQWGPAWLASAFRLLSPVVALALIYGTVICLRRGWWFLLIPPAFYFTAYLPIPYVDRRLLYAGYATLPAIAGIGFAFGWPRFVEIVHSRRQALATNE